MSIFNKFTDTIFLKEDSELENKVKVLKDLNERFPSNKKIAKELKIAEYGLKGEKEIEYCLKNANIGMYVLHDINLVVDDYKAQIDYIVITPSKCYLIECKNMIGEITIDETGQFVRKYNDIETAIESPLRQSQRHREILQKIINSNKKGILDLFFSREKFEEYFDSIVVFANNSAIINMKNAPDEIKEKVIRSDELVNHIIKDTKLFGDNDSQKAMKDLAERFLKRNVKEEVNYDSLFNINTTCPRCGGNLKEKNGVHGKFIGCTNYPECNYTEDIKEEN